MSFLVLTFTVSFLGKDQDFQIVAKLLIKVTYHKSLITNIK